MNSDKELANFIRNLLETFSYLHMHEIPVGNGQFRRGVENLKTTLENVFPTYYNELSAAFIPDVITGDYSVIERAMYSSSLVSLEASFDILNIKSSQPIQKPTEFFETLAESFRRGLRQ
jgi:hypothetical protein